MLSLYQYEKTIVALLTAGDYAGADELFRELAALFAALEHGKVNFMVMYNDCIAQAQENVTAVGEKRNVLLGLKGFEALSTKKKSITNLYTGKNTHAY